MAAIQTIQNKYLHENPEENSFWNHKYLLFMHNVSAVFDGFTALNIPDLGIKHNELRVVIGPNGAGKTTMCDCITGKTRPTTGGIFFDGTEITTLPEPEIVARGIGRKFQTPAVFDSLTVYQNMELALPGRKDPWAIFLARESNIEKDKIESILNRVNLYGVMDLEARFLSHGQRQWLAISCLILSNPKLLLIDEPAAGLTESETEKTGDLLLELKRDHTLLVIEHDMNFVRQLNTIVSVLCEGVPIAEGKLEDLKQNQQVVDAYLGR